MAAGGPAYVAGGGAPNLGAGATQDFMEALLESVPCHEAPGVFKLILRLGQSTTWEDSIRRIRASNTHERLMILCHGWAQWLLYCLFCQPSARCLVV